MISDIKVKLLKNVIHLQVIMSYLSYTGRNKIKIVSLSSLTPQVTTPQVLTLRFSFRNALYVLYV